MIFYSNEDTTPLMITFYIKFQLIVDNIHHLQDYQIYLKFKENDYFQELLIIFTLLF